MKSIICLILIFQFIPLIGQTRSETSSQLLEKQGKNYLYKDSTYINFKALEPLIIERQSYSLIQSYRKIRAQKSSGIFLIVSGQILLVGGVIANFNEAPPAFGLGCIFSTPSNPCPEVKNKHADTILWTVGAAFTAYGILLLVRSSKNKQKLIKNFNDKVLPMLGYSGKNFGWNAGMTIYLNRTGK